MDSAPLVVVNRATSLRLPWPPTENNYKIPIRCGSFVKMALSKEARVYYSEVDEAIRLQFGSAPLVPYRGPVRVDIELRAPDRRRRDVANYDKCVLDAMTHSGVWTDDFLVDELTIRRGQPIRGGRVLILIAPLGPDLPDAHDPALDDQPDNG